MSKQLVLDAFNNKKVERVPVGFWFHFVEGDEFNQGVEKDYVIQKNIEGHKKFYEEFKPDFVKLMSDGFFIYPNEVLLNLDDVEALSKIKPLGKNHPWIKKQVQLVKAQTALFNNEVASFYNIFSPATFLSLLLETSGSELTIVDYFKKDKKVLKHVLDVIAEDLRALVKGVITQGNADGIYLSVKNIQDSSVKADDYKAIIAPSELSVLKEANAHSENNILHICGYEGAKNDLNIYKDYDAKVINWAVNVEGIHLSEGKKLFGGKAVIGGFDNTVNGTLYKGSQEEIENLTELILKDAGTRGIILGADCTVPSDIELKRLEWVRNKAKSLSN